MTVFDKLKLKIKADLDLNVIRIERHYPGYNMRAHGAWVWSAETDTGRTIGSPFPASDLVKKGTKLIWGHYGEIELD